jgi:hypothetical protein
LPVCVLLISANSCGFTANKPAVFIPPHLNDVYVFTFRNDLLHRDLAHNLLDEVEKRLKAVELIRLLEVPAGADGVIEGTLHRLFFQPTVFTPDGRIDQARYCLELDFSFRDLVKDRLLLENEKILVVRVVSLLSPPVSDLVLIQEAMVVEAAERIVRLVTTGMRDDINLMYGYEDQMKVEDDGTLIGKPRRNFDLNNDGIDDRYQTLTNGAAPTNF